MYSTQKKIEVTNMAAQAESRTQRFALLVIKTQHWNVKPFQIIAKHSTNVAKTGANNSSGISTAWVVMRVTSYLLGTNKGSGERLTLVSVLWTSSLQQWR